MSVGKPITQVDMRYSTVQSHNTVTAFFQVSSYRLLVYQSSTLYSCRGECHSIQPEIT